jgi:hypothetical protein
MIRPDSVRPAGADDVEAGDRVVGVEVVGTGALGVEKVCCTERTPQPGSSGMTNHAIARITAEQMRDTRYRECLRCLIDRICLRRTALRRRIRRHLAILYLFISRLRNHFCVEKKVTVKHWS